MTEEATETWLPVVRFPLYEVSSSARIRNVKTLRLVRQRRSPNGYWIVDLHSGARYGFGPSKQSTMLTHVLVCEAFHGPKPSPLHEVAHNDGIRTNPLPGNLRWATRSENFSDKKLHGTNNDGSRNGAAKLTEVQAACILAMPRHYTERDLGAMFGVSGGQIGKIRRGEKWAILHDIHAFVSSMKAPQRPASHWWHQQFPELETPIPM